jgi:two-component system, response regulator
MSENNTMEIILMEDNSDDSELTICALKKYNPANQLLYRKDGQEAINYIFSQKTGRLRKLILLDRKPPKIDGSEVLRKIKSDNETKMIPVMVLTSSKEEQVIVQSYELGVNAYMRKPVKFESFIKAVSGLGLFRMVFNLPPVQSV